MEWQHIDYAPKDGTILLFTDEKETKVDVARWSQGEWSSVFGEMDDTMVKWKTAGI